MLIHEFWASLDRSGECWLWTGSVNSSGYGSLGIDGEKRSWMAHRLAYSLTQGAIPKGKIVRHSCDTPRCCNPAHLLVGTYKDNSRDMLERGRCWHRNKTHCPRGHEYSGDNVSPLKGGHRWCRQCERDRSHQRVLAKNPNARRQPRGSATCWRGHEYTEENTYRWTTADGRPQKACRTCARERQRKTA